MKKIASPDFEKLAKPSNQLQVELVFDHDANQILEARTWIATQTEGQLHSYRPDIRSSGKSFFCYCCGEPVHLSKALLEKNGHEHGHFFVHDDKLASEKKKCEFQQKKRLPQDLLDRMRYQGQREGPRHKAAKNLVDLILQCDQRFDKPKIEQVWKTFDEGWRKPDVRTSLNGQEIVFEIQVSNTYPSVVGERTSFYRNKAILIWVCDDRIYHDWRTMHSDLFCSNNNHLFWVDQDCLDKSKQESIAYLKMYVEWPDVEPFQCPEGYWRLAPCTKEHIMFVPIANLHFDIEKQKATIFDIEQLNIISSIQRECANCQADNGKDIEKLDYAIVQLTGWDTQRWDRSKWRTSLKSFAVLICALEAFKLEKAIGTRCKNPLDVANILCHESHRRLFNIFCLSFEVTGGKIKNGSKLCKLMDEQRLKPNGDYSLRDPKREADLLKLVNKIFSGIPALTVEA